MVERVIKKADKVLSRKLKDQEAQKLKKKAVAKVKLQQQKVFSNIDMLFRICEKRTKQIQTSAAAPVKDDTHNISLNSEDSLSSYEQERLTQGLN